MIKYTLLIFILFACSTSTTEPAFAVSSPEAKNTVWQRHVGLPKFDAKRHSDGCSGGMSALYKKLTFLHKKHGAKLKWHNCCVIHDEAYYYGGTKEDKTQADKNLSQCVSKVVGNKFLGKTMQLAVKIGGSPHLPTSYRWGYGEDFRQSQ